MLLVVLHNAHTGSLLFANTQGGVSAIADVRHLAELDHPRLDGVIIGKAIYEGLIQLEEALANAR